MNGAYCSADGMVFDGTDDFLDVTPWQFGGSITVEAFVKYASIPASEWLRIMCFSDSDGTDRVELTNQDGTGMARIVVRTGGTYYAHSSTSSSVFEVDKWAHIVATVEGTTAKIYVNGVLESTGSNVPEPGTATRDYHYIGGRVDNADSYFDGTIAYLRLWHGKALSADEVRSLYVDLGSHKFDFRGCTDGVDVADAFDASITATAMNGATCSSDGMVFDGSDDYVDVTPWPFGGEAMTVEAYVKLDQFDNWEHVLNFHNTNSEEAIFFAVFDSDGTTNRWSVRQGSTELVLDTSDFWAAATWIHVVLTTEDTTMKTYKNGALVDTTTSGQEPVATTRDNHWLGKAPDAWNQGVIEGTIAYIRFWDGIALNADEVLALYQT